MDVTSPHMVTLSYSYRQGEFNIRTCVYRDHKECEVFEEQWQRGAAIRSTVSFRLIKVINLLT